MTGPRYAPRQVRDRAGTTGLPESLKAGIENLSRVSMDDVRVHPNSARPSALRALAYTQGTDIYLAPGQERNLAHEAWHVVQQKQGRVQPTLRAGSLSINTDRGLEQEADRRGAQAASAGPRGVPAAPPRAQGTRTDVIQGMFTYPKHKDEQLESLLSDVRRFLDENYSHLVGLFDKARDSNTTHRLAEWLEVHEVVEEVREIPSRKKTKKKKKKKRARSASTKRKGRGSDDEDDEPKKKTHPKLIDKFGVQELDEAFDPEQFPDWTPDEGETTAMEDDDSSSDDDTDFLFGPGELVTAQQREAILNDPFVPPESTSEVEREALYDRLKRSGGLQGPSHQALQSVFTLATLNIDHYAQSKDVVEKNVMATTAMTELTKIRKQKTRMDEIAYFLSTDNPDVLVVQEINDFDGFKRDFESAQFMMPAIAESGDIYAVGLDRLPEAGPSPSLLSSQYTLIEQPRWSAGSWSEKNAIIVNTATMDVSSELWILKSGEKTLKKIKASDPQDFGKSESGKKAEHQPRDPVVTKLTYNPGTPAERKIAVINVHTSPSGDLKKQNEDILAALRRIARQLTDVDAAFAIGDFYMEKSNPEMFEKLHAKVKELDQPEFTTGSEADFAGVRTKFDTNIPTPHASAYKLWDHEWDEKKRKFVRRKETASPPAHEPRETSKKGQKADILVYRDDQWRPFNKLPNIYPPMFPAYPSEQGVRDTRTTRYALEDLAFITEASSGKETFKLASGGVVVLEQKHIDAWGKPIADHALRIFRGELPATKNRMLQRRKSMRLGVKQRKQEQLATERRAEVREEERKRRKADDLARRRSMERSAEASTEEKTTSKRRSRKVRKSRKRKK